MSRFSKRDGLYGVETITGPRSVILRLELRPERNEFPEVVPLFTQFPYRDPDPATVRARVLEGTDEANREFGTSLHPWMVKYAVEDYRDECPVLRYAARAILERLAQQGESGYEKDWV
jgi:hypothetical protein